jgi:hypothetical protein
MQKCKGTFQNIILFIDETTPGKHGMQKCKGRFQNITLFIDETTPGKHQNIRKYTLFYTEFKLQLKKSGSRSLLLSAKDIRKSTIHS